MGEAMEGKPKAQIAVDGTIPWAGLTVTSAVIECENISTTYESVRQVLAPGRQDGGFTAPVGDKNINFKA